MNKIFNKRNFLKSLYIIAHLQFFIICAIAYHWLGAPNLISSIVLGLAVYFVASRVDVLFSWLVYKLAIFWGQPDLDWRWNIKYI